MAALEWEGPKRGTDMENRQTLPERVTVDPDVLAGKPCIRGMRISVEHILDALAAGILPQQLLEEYSVLELEDIKAALLYAKDLVAGERVYHVTRQS